MKVKRFGLSHLTDCETVGEETFSEQLTSLDLVESRGCICTAACFYWYVMVRKQWPVASTRFLMWPEYRSYCYVHSRM